MAFGFLKDVGGAIKGAGKAVASDIGGAIKGAGGGIKDAGKWAYENIDELDDTLRLKQIAQIGQFIPGPQQPLVKGLAMVYAGSDAFKATSEGNPLGVLSAGLQMAGSSKIDTGPTAWNLEGYNSPISALKSNIGGNIKNYLPQGEWLAGKYGALPGIGKSMVQRAGLQALMGSGRPDYEGGYYPPSQISAGAPIQGSRAAPYMADYNLRTPQFAEGGWISPRPNGDGVITTLGDTPSGEEVVIPADKYLAYMANGGTVGRIPSFANGKGFGPSSEWDWWQDNSQKDYNLLDLILKDEPKTSKWDNPWFDLFGYGGILGQMIWDYKYGKKPAEQAQERAEYANAYRDAVRPAQTGRREFPTYERVGSQISGYGLPELAGGAYIESNRAMPGLVAEAARQKGPLMASEYVGSLDAVERDLGLTRRGVQDVLDTKPMTLQRFANGGAFKVEEPLDYYPPAPGGTLTTAGSTIEEILPGPGGNITNPNPFEVDTEGWDADQKGDTTTATKPVIDYNPGTVRSKTQQDITQAFENRRQRDYDLRGLTSGYEELVSDRGTGIFDRARQRDDRANRDMNQIKKDYWMQLDANRRANEQSASAIDVAQRGAGRDDYMADIYGWNVGDTSDINWASLGDKAAGNMRMSRFSPGDMAADWVEDRRRSRYVRDQYR